MRKKKRSIGIPEPEVRDMWRVIERQNTYLREALAHLSTVIVEQQQMMELLLPRTTITNHEAWKYQQRWRRAQKLGEGVQ